MRDEKAGGAFRFLRLPEVTRVTGLSGATIYGQIRKGQFPGSYKLTDDGFAVGWKSDEIEAWLRARRAAAEEPPPIEKRRGRSAANRSAPSVGSTTSVQTHRQDRDSHEKCQT
jgi:prophage regulatory protein